MKSGPHRQWAMGPCFWCGEETHRSASNSTNPNSYTRDHLIPLKLRRIGLLKHATGRLAQFLTVTCCLACNRKKGGQSAYRFAALLNLPAEKIKTINRAYSMNSRA